jgi:UDP-N-acetylglucosamine acyltransferase
MAVNIHPTSVVHKDADLAEGVSVGPFCVIHNDVRIGENTRLESHVTIEPGSRIGKNCHIWPGAVIGGPPQDHKYRGEKSLLIVGDNNVIREYVTLHRAAGENVATTIGDDNMLMAYAHVGHNCSIGSHNTFSSYVGLSGHVTVEDHVVMGGMTGAHQFTRIGKIAMIGGCGKVNRDIPPYMLADGNPVRVLDVNKIGLRRQGMSPNTRTTIRQAYKLLFRSNLNLSQALERIEDELEPSDELDYLMEFLRGTHGSYGGRGNEAPRG